MADEAGGAKGKVEKPEIQAVITLVCGFYMLYWLFLRVKEANEYLGREVANPIFSFIPGLCILALWNLCGAVEEMQQKAGAEPKDEKIIDFLCCFVCGPFGFFRLQGKLNEVWEK